VFQAFVKDLLQYFPAQVVPTILGFVSIPLFTRIMSAEQFGQLVLIKSSVQIMVLLMSWLRPAIIRFYPAVPEQEVSVLVRTAFWAQLALTSGTGIMVFIGCRILSIDPNLLSLVGIGVLVFILESIFQLLLTILRSRRQVNAFSTLSIWEQLGSLGFGILLAVGFHLGVVGILWGNVLGLSLVLPFLGRIVYREMRIVGSVSCSLLGQLAWYGIPLTIGQLTAWALNYSDRYLIQLFYSMREVGMYSAVYTLSLHSITFLGVLIRFSSTPILTNVWEKQGKDASISLLNSVTRMYLLIGIPMVAGMSVLAEPIMKVMTGIEFSEGSIIVPWIAGGAFFLGLQHRFNQVLSLLNRTGIIMLTLIICSLINILLNWFLLPFYGYKIAAITTLFCYLLLCIIQALVSRRFLRWHFPWRTAGYSVGAATAMYVGVWGLMRIGHLPSLGILALSVPFGILIYGFSIWISGEMSLKERTMLKNIVNNRL
jgi:O-antigen/teichoic acid export membrane protein